MSTLRESFIKQFGESNAFAVQRAAESHKNGIHDRYGSDPFRWAILICLGHECLSRFQEEHGISLDYEQFRSWLIDHASEFAEYDGDVDYVALMVGVYDFATINNPANYVRVVQQGIASLFA